MNIKKGLKIQKAKAFARDLHKDHSRLTGENVFRHVSRVHNHLRDAGVQDEDILIASLLHQSLTFSKEIEPLVKKEFGEEVWNIINAYHKLSDASISFESAKGVNEKYIIQTYLNLADDLRILLVRLADKVDNIQTAFALEPDHRKRVAEKALYLYAPIARLLGLMQFTKALENGAFKVLQPREYYVVKLATEEKRPEIERFFSRNIPAIKELLKENEINASISHRTKHLYSIYRKALEKEQSGKYADVLDIAAMRVLVPTDQDCYKTEALISEIWDALPEFRDDYIKNPKASGYKSIHNQYMAEKNVQLEVQIRTHEMHEYNEYGPASHVFYKIGSSLKDNLAKNPNWLKELTNWKDVVRYNKAMGDLRLLDNTKNVYAFTPKGDIIRLPEGSTPVDFAYAIHTNVGHACMGAIINGHIAKLDQKIQNGDQIEIKTLASKKKPSSDWLKFVKSPDAKMEIKRALKLTHKRAA